MAGIRIEWVFRDPISVAQREVFFFGAARRWAKVITGWPKGANGQPALNVLTIVVRMADLNEDSPLDGPFTLAHVDLLRQLETGPAAFIPTQAEMLLDKAKFPERSQAEAPAIRDLVAHEIGHALGFGKIWEEKHLVSERNGKKVYTGQFATEEYAQLAPRSNGAPMEDEGGPGTARAHWDEDVNDRSELGRKLLYELMSGTIQKGDNRLSRLTVAAMKDLGYEVDMAAAEGYRTHD